MNNKLIVSLVAVILLGTGAFFVLSNEDSDTVADTTDATETTEMNDVTLDSDGNPTLPETVYVGPYQLSGSVEDVADATQNGTINLVYESDSLWSLTVASVDGTASTVFDGEFIYIGSDSEGWIRRPDTGDSDFDTSIDAFSFDNEDLQDFQEDGVAYDGTTDCPLGTCHVWTGAFVDEESGDAGTASLSISTDGRTNSWQVVSNSVNLDFTYTYGDSVKVDVPTDFVVL